MTEQRWSLEQQTAIELCCDFQARIVGITGGAGTGKTSVLGRAYEELRAKLPASKIALCAPTGRAAKRVQELTGIPATTIHRLLEYPTPEDYDPKSEEEPIENKPRRNKYRPLEQKVILVDEASMVGPTLHAQLMEALPNNGAIRFFGDNNQLPPVEPGVPPFLAILARDKENVTLSYNYRSDDMIVANALRILKGSVPAQNARFRVLYTDYPIKYLVDFVTKEFADADHQIIMPTRKGNYGTVNVNPRLQVKLNPRGPSLKLDRHDDQEAGLTVRRGDKFLWTKNDYNLALFNGEIGEITDVDPEDGSLEVSTSERQVHIPSQLKTFSPYHGSIIRYDPRKHIELGYAVTTHKAQGSEFHTIIYCITGGQAFLLNRQNFYTAVTRAKQQVIMICDRKAMGLSLRKHR
jgi:exodeoxyribonuclease V alpha subunit